MSAFDVDQEFNNMTNGIGLGELPTDDVQYLEMRKAFIGGCLIMFQTVVSLQSLDEEVAVQNLDAIAQHLMTVKI